MRFESVKEPKSEAFRRLAGVTRNSFEAMAALLVAEKRKQNAAGGEPDTLCIEDKLPMMIEYRAYFHIGQAYNLSESTAYRNIKWCEDTLVKGRAFRLPGCKSIAAGEQVFDAVLTGAAETPAGRPKTRALLFG